MFPMDNAFCSRFVQQRRLITRFSLLDVLTLGLMQINPPMTNFRTELLVHNLQIFLNTHPNSGVILTHAWHSR
jgi:hypothetical protein